MLDDLNTAQADEIKFGDEAAIADSQHSESSAESSQEEPATAGEKGESTDHQAEAEGGKTTDEAKATDGELKEPGEQQEESAGGGKAEGETATEKPDPDEFLRELTEGKIENAAGLSSLLEENQRLRSELEKPRVPEFANERAKKAYEYLQSHSGEFDELTREAHRVLSIDPEGMNDKELQFEAFALQRKDLSRADAARVFNMKFEKLFGELEDDPDNIILQDELKVASIEARAAIQKAQQDLQSELAPKEADAKAVETTEQENANQLTPEQIEEVQRAVNQSLDGFKELQINLGKEGKEVVNIALNDGQKDALNKAMTNPAELLDAAIAQFGKSDGTFDYNGYRNFLTQFIHHDRIVQESYNQGINVGKRMALDGAKNLDTKEPPAQKEADREPTFVDALVNAYQGRGR